MIVLLFLGSLLTLELILKSDARVTKKAASKQGKATIPPVGLPIDAGVPSSASMLALMKATEPREAVRPAYATAHQESAEKLVAQD